MVSLQLPSQQKLIFLISHNKNCILQVHHGGAGTTATGLKAGVILLIAFTAMHGDPLLNLFFCCSFSARCNGLVFLSTQCPTTIVPFFGDQFFWGEIIYQKGLGPAPIPISQLTVESLTEAIRFMLQPEVRTCEEHDEHLALARTVFLGCLMKLKQSCR